MRIAPKLTETKQTGRVEPLDPTELRRLVDGIRVDLGGDRAAYLQVARELAARATTPAESMTAVVAFERFRGDPSVATEVVRNWATQWATTRQGEPMPQGAPMMRELTQGQARFMTELFDRLADGRSFDPSPALAAVRRELEVVASGTQPGERLSKLPAWTTQWLEAWLTVSYAPVDRDKAKMALKLVNERMGGGRSATLFPEMAQFQRRLEKLCA